MVGERHFKVVGSDVGFTGGLYKGSPYAAAKKAANSMFRNNTKKTKIEFLLKEITNDSKKREFAYQAMVHMLNPPVVTILAGQEIWRTRQVKVKALVRHRGGDEEYDNDDEEAE